MSESKDELERIEHEKVGGGYVGKTGIIFDFINAWVTIPGIFLCEEMAEKLGKKSEEFRLPAMEDLTVPTYRDYVERFQDEVQKKRILDMSDWDKVEVLDKLAQLWNSQKEDLVKRKKKEQINLFYEIANKLIRG